VGGSIRNILLINNEPMRRIRIKNINEPNINEPVRRIRIKIISAE
jgi:hypothetical protein